MGNPLSVWNVERAFHLPHNLIYLRDFILMRNTPNVGSMGKSLPVPHTYDIREPILVRNPITVRDVGKTFQYDTQLSLHQIIHTGERL